MPYCYLTMGPPRGTDRMLLVPVLWPWEVWEVIPERLLMMMLMIHGVRRLRRLCPTHPARAQLPSVLLTAVLATPSLPNPCPTGMWPGVKSLCKIWTLIHLNNIKAILSVFRNWESGLARRHQVLDSYDSGQIPKPGIWHIIIEGLSLLIVV